MNVYDKSFLNIVIIIVKIWLKSDFENELDSTISTIKYCKTDSSTYSILERKRIGDQLDEQDLQTPTRKASL